MSETSIVVQKWKTYFLVHQVFRKHVLDFYLLTDPPWSPHPEQTALPPHQLLSFYLTWQYLKHISLIFTCPYTQSQKAIQNAHRKNIYYEWKFLIGIDIDEDSALKQTLIRLTASILGGYTSNSGHKHYTCKSLLNFQEIHYFLHRHRQKISNIMMLKILPSSFVFIT